MSKAIEVPNQSTNQLKRLARQSTIYRRHEARLARSSTRRDDPRPAAVRVLSGLPFFRNFVTSYKLPSESVKQEEPLTSPPSVSFSQDTIFTSEVGSAAEGPTENLSQPLLHTVLAAAAGGTLSELVLGGSPSKLSLGTEVLCYLTGSATPFLTLQGGGHDSVLTFSPGHASLPMKSYKCFLVDCPPERGMARVASSAAFTSILFGAKSMADSSFKRGDDVNCFSLNKFVSSATAGVVAATLLAPIHAVQSHMMKRRIAFTAPQLSFQHAAMSLVQSNGLSSLYRGSNIVYGREIMAFTLYFTSYDAIKCHFSNGDDGKTTTSTASMTTVASSGAAAGMLYRSIVCAFNAAYSGSCMGLGLSRAFFPSVLRAAPANALLFVGYETALVFKASSKQQ